MGCCEAKDLKAKFVDADVDLTLLDDVLNKYKGIKGSLITILQYAQEI